MNRNESGTSEVGPGEAVLLTVVALVVAGSVLTAATWERTVDWLVSRRVLVDAGDNPLLSIPAADGAGLDARRSVLAVAALGLVVVLLISAHRTKAFSGGER